MNIEKIISEMTFEEKAKFITGTDSVYTYFNKEMPTPFSRQEKHPWVNNTLHDIKRVDEYIDPFLFLILI